MRNVELFLLPVQNGGTKFRLNRLGRDRNDGCHYPLTGKKFGFHHSALGAKKVPHSAPLSIHTPRINTRKIKLEIFIKYSNLGFKCVTIMTRFIRINWIGF